MSFPTKEQRQTCWNARDRYWECLDKNGDQNEQCLEIRTLYEASCPSQWVKHFDRKRSYLKFKSRIENEGIQTACSPEVGTMVPSTVTATSRHRVYRQVVRT